MSAASHCKVHLICDGAIYRIYVIITGWLSWGPMKINGTSEKSGTSRLTVRRVVVDNMQDFTLDDAQDLALREGLFYEEKGFKIDVVEAPFTDDDLSLVDLGSKIEWLEDAPPPSLRKRKCWKEIALEDIVATKPE